jgi:hypothetical protein
MNAEFQYVLARSDDGKWTLTLPCKESFDIYYRGKKSRPVSKKAQIELERIYQEELEMRRNND